MSNEHDQQAVEDSGEQELDEAFSVEYVTDDVIQVVLYITPKPMKVQETAWQIAFMLDQIYLVYEKETGVSYRDFDRIVMGARGMLMSRQPKQRKANRDFDGWPFKGDSS